MPFNSVFACISHCEICGRLLENRFDICKCYIVKQKQEERIAMEERVMKAATEYLAKSIEEEEDERCLKELLIVDAAKKVK